MFFSNRSEKQLITAHALSTCCKSCDEIWLYEFSKLSVGRVQGSCDWDDCDILLQKKTYNTFVVYRQLHMGESSFVLKNTTNITFYLLLTFIYSTFVMNSNNDFRGLVSSWQYGVLLRKVFQTADKTCTNKVYMRTDEE